MNRKEFQKLAAVRLREAKLLLAADAPDGAYYLAGYVVEFALKACIAKSTQRHDFPEKVHVIRSHTHNTRELISVAGLKAPLQEAVRQYEFYRRWEIVVQWSEESRYTGHSLQEAANLIEARYGILQWLKKRY